MCRIVRFWTMNTFLFHSLCRHACLHLLLDNYHPLESYFFSWSRATALWETLPPLLPIKYFTFLQISLHTVPITIGRDWYLMRQLTYPNVISLNHRIVRLWIMNVFLIRSLCFHVYVHLLVDSFQIPGTVFLLLVESYSPMRALHRLWTSSIHLCRPTSSSNQICYFYSNHLAHNSINGRNRHPNVIFLKYLFFRIWIVNTFLVCSLCCLITYTYS